MSHRQISICPGHAKITSPNICLWALFLRIRGKSIFACGTLLLRVRGKLIFAFGDIIFARLGQINVCMWNINCALMGQIDICLWDILFARPGQINTCLWGIIYARLGQINHQPAFPVWSPGEGRSEGSKTGNRLSSKGAVQKQFKQCLLQSAEGAGDSLAVTREAVGGYTCGWQGFGGMVSEV